MKLFRFFALLIPVFVSCEKVGDEKLVFLPSFIIQYDYAPLRALYFEYQEERRIDLNLVSMDGYAYYQASEVGGTGSSAAKFLEIAERNGDRSYNRSDPYSLYGGREACADNFSAIHVVCEDAPWNETHPAGAALDDLFTVNFTTYTPFIRGGYQGYPSLTTVKKRLTELTQNDLTMIRPDLSLFFDLPAKSGIYRLKITMVTTEGKEKTAKCTVKL